MKKIVILILGFTVLSGIVNAQDQTASSTIYLKSKFLGMVYVKDGVEYKLGQLGNEMQGEPDSLALLNDWEKYGTISAIFSYCFSAGLAGALYFGIFKSVFKPEGAAKKDAVIGLGCLLGALAFEFPMIIYNYKAGNALHKCIWTHNQHVVQGAKTSLYFDPVNREGGLGLSLRF